MRLFKRKKRRALTDKQKLKFLKENTATLLRTYNQLILVLIEAHKSNQFTLFNSTEQKFYQIRRALGGVDEQKENKK